MPSKIRKVVFATRAVAIVAVASGAAQATWAQGTPANTSEEYRVVYLKNTFSRNDANDLQTTVRNMVSNEHLYYDPSSNAISLYGPPAKLDLAQKVIASLDIPKHAYRITYTLTETDKGQRIGVQHDSLVAVPGQLSSLKEGSRVPIFATSQSPGPGQTAPTMSDVQYLDIGLDINARLTSTSDALNLETKIVQSSVADDKPAPPMTDPVIRQTSLEGTILVTPGKPLKLGALDVPGSTRHIDVEVMVEPVH